MTEHYGVIGLMSGTSMDGLDIVYAVFSENAGTWKYDIRESETLEYPSLWLKKLSQAFYLDQEALALLDVEYGQYLGKAIKRFMEEKQVCVDLVASHGHTIFHEPENGFTLQIGCGKEIHKLINIPVAYNFREQDVKLGGQGAPLVPIGDKLLFGEFDVCLNLGGIANLSHDENGHRIAYDITFCNMALNYLSGQKGMAFDEGGRLARKGKVNQEMLFQLNNLPYFEKNPPKSLGREWFENEVKAIIDKNNCLVEDKLASCVEHVAMQLANSINGLGMKNILITGGGAFNIFLIERIKYHVQAEAIVPDSQLVSFKEALVFAFLGLRRKRGEINVLSSVTGASEDHVAGDLVV